MGRLEEFNSLDLETANEVQRRLDAWASNDMISALVLQGVGGNYCGGVDLDWLAAHRNESEQLFAALGKLYSSVSQYQKPLVALVNGDINGGGLGLANTPFRIVTNAVRFSVPEPSFGLVPDGPTIKILTHADKVFDMPIAAYLCLSGHSISAPEMMHFGLATHIVDPSSVEIISRHLSSISYLSKRELSAAISDALSLFCDSSTDPGMATMAWDVVKDAEGKVGDGMDGQAGDGVDGRTFPWSQDDQDVLKECFSSESVVETWKRLEARADTSQLAKDALVGMQSSPPIGILATRRLVAESAALSEADAAALATWLKKGSCRARLP